MSARTVGFAIGDEERALLDELDLDQHPVDDPADYDAEVPENFAIRRCTHAFR